MIASSTMRVIGPRALVDVKLEPTSTFVVIEAARAHATLCCTCVGKCALQLLVTAQGLYGSSAQHSRTCVVKYRHRSYDTAVEQLLREDFADPNAEMHTLPSMV